MSLCFIQPRNTNIPPNIFQCYWVKLLLQGWIVFTSLRYLKYIAWYTSCFVIAVNASVKYQQKKTKNFIRSFEKVNKEFPNHWLVYAFRFINGKNSSRKAQRSTGQEEMLIKNEGKGTSGVWTHKKRTKKDKNVTYDACSLNPVTWFSTLLWCFQPCYEMNVVLFCIK